MDWWREQLKVEFVADLIGILPRVEKALRERETAGRSGKTLQNYAESLAAFCDWCVSRGYLDTDPLDDLASFDTAPRTTRRAMTTDEIAKLLGSCAPHRRLCYEVAFASGLRAGELRALKVRDLARDAQGLRLEAAWTKNRKAGFQPLPSWIVDQLAEASMNKASDESLLYVPSHPARELDEDLASAGIPKRTADGKLDFHACRVAFVSWVVEAGASLKEAQLLARHATPGLTMNTYARARDGRLAEVAEAVGQNFRSTTGAQHKSARTVSRARTSDRVVEAAGIEPASI